MRVILPPYYKRSSNLNNPFGEDYFLRRQFANNLTNLFRGAEESMVLTLNAKWGEGKTTFIKQWERSLKEDEQFIPIYYDAFQNDFTSDVFFSIAVSIQEALIAHFKSIGKDPHKSEKIDFLKQSTIELAKELFIIGAETASNFYGGSTFGLKDFVRKVFGQYQNYKEEKERKFLDEKFNSFLDLKNSIKKYQRKLDKILEHSGRSNNKIIFFVDELDRCRPNFAVEVIEKIKHLFEVPNVYFLLAINKEQLLKTIKNVYGVGEEEAFIYLFTKICSFRNRTTFNV